MQLHAWLVTRTAEEAARVAAGGEETLLRSSSDAVDPMALRSVCSHSMLHIQKILSQGTSLDAAGRNSPLPSGLADDLEVRPL